MQPRTATDADGTTWTFTRDGETYTATSAYWTVTLDDIGNVLEATPARPTNYCLGSFHAENTAQELFERFAD